MSLVGFLVLLIIAAICGAIGQALAGYSTGGFLISIVLGFIGAFQEFTLPWLLTQGGPAKSTELYVMNLYRNAFIQLSMGKASAMAWILLVIIVIFTVILFNTSARWVYYGGEK